MINPDFLDQSHKMLLEGRVFPAMSHLNSTLRQARDASTADDWNRFCLEDCPRHPIHALLQQDPFTNHSFRRPRGYAGDAELMDIIYRRTPLPADITPLGEHLYEFGMSSPMSHSVRARRVALRATLDDVAEKNEAMRVLSVASGHLREAEFSRALQSGRLEVLTVFDQDEHSLAEVKSCYGHLKVQLIAGSGRDILSGAVAFEDYDFIYSAGLYDYLLAPTARRLTAKLFEFLRPGGTLLLANFLPDLRDAGYMEAFMRWPLVYRSATEMDDLATTTAPDALARRECFYDPPGCVVFLELMSK